MRETTAIELPTLYPTKLRVFTTPPSSERAGNNVASASKATEAHKVLCTKKNARL